ncbi:CBASS cGAMP-activated phospholipase [Acidocella sp.]|uniref:CBASS cGAMP-activated phospholipase n=1 Tax=Acidocella sp. TaxID=50710 RepID=UPI002615B38A|nr:CBASS cGAMP-activated phospholipase [Acidocella sp.]
MTYVPPRRSDGAIQHRRQVLPWPSDRPFRILSIDGGGICGILPSSVLAELENRFLGGTSIAGHFDLIAGTSTGGIIALGLAHGLTAAEIRNFYVDRGDRVFSNPNALVRLWRKVRRFRRNAYDSTALHEELLTIFGETTLGDARTRLCIPSFEGIHGDIWLFKTPHHPDYKKDRFERMVNVALATSAAPTYLRALPNNGYMMVDGGIWANNPVMNAVTEALSCFDIERQQIQILSLGCGETSFKVDDSRAVGGLLSWRNVLRAAMRAQSLNALGQAGLLLGKENLVRIDAPETPNPIAMDDHRRAKAELPAMARSLAEASGQHIRHIFLQERAQPYKACPHI